MRNLILVTVFFMSGLAISYAQSLAPTVFSSGGANSSSAKIKLSATIGEAIVTTETNGKHILTQGFQQGAKIIYNSVIEYNPSIKVNAYPNPASDYIYLNVSGLTHKRVYVNVINIMGQKVEIPLLAQSYDSGEQIRLDLSQIQKGSYLIRVYDAEDQNTYADIKIIKIR